MGNMFLFDLALFFGLVEVGSLETFYVRHF